MNWVNIGSDNGLSPGRHQAVTWTDADLLLFGPLWRNLSEILINTKLFIHENAFEDIVCKMAVILSRGGVKCHSYPNCSMKEESTYIMRTLDNLCINMVQFVDQSFYHIIFQGTVFEDGNPCNLFDTTIYILTV